MVYNPCSGGWLARVHNITISTSHVNGRPNQPHQTFTLHSSYDSQLIPPRIGGWVDQSTHLLKFVCTDPSQDRTSATEVQLWYSSTASYSMANHSGCHMQTTLCLKKISTPKAGWHKFIKISSPIIIFHTRHSRLVAERLSSKSLVRVEYQLQGFHGNKTTNNRMLFITERIRRRRRLIYCL